MVPWKGYAVRATSSTANWRIWRGSSNGIRKPLVQEPDYDWALSLIVESEKAIDLNSMVGSTDGAIAGVDSYDYVEPPPVGEYISAYFILADSTAVKYTTDVRGGIGEGEMWTLYIEHNQTGTPIDVQVEGLETLPPNYKAWLVDLNTFGRQDLSLKPHYRFVDRGTERQFKILVGTDQFVDGAMPGIVPVVSALDSNYPNPFNAMTTIPYQLSEEGSVELMIYNMTGQTIRTLVHTNQQPGFYKVYWNGENDAGKSVGSGIYFYVLRTGSVKRSKKMVLVQ